MRSKSFIVIFTIVGPPSKWEIENHEQKHNFLNLKYTYCKEAENNEYGAGMQSCLVNFGGVLLAGSARGGPIALAASQSIPQKAFCAEK